MSESFIPPEARLPEITLKVVVLSILLAIILAAANTYLALRIGMLTSASIPAAIISMGILRFFKQSNILENNLVQTCASAGEAVAGGVVYTVPALIIIHYWMHFNYWQSIGIAALGGLLGVFFSIPLRRLLVKEKSLNFPEGRAIAEVLQASTEKAFGLREILAGGSIGAVVELAQTGLKVIASQIQFWAARGHTLYGVGFGFSATMVGAGYLVGFNVCFSIIIGAVIGWVIGVPVVSSFYPLTDPYLPHAVMSLWDQKIRYIGIGAMLVAGLWTLTTLIKPFWQSLRTTKAALTSQLSAIKNAPIRTDYDMPYRYVLIGIALCLAAMFFLFQHTFHFEHLQLPLNVKLPFELGAVLYVLIIGFLFSAICGYFSGLVGVSASPGSAIVIAGLLLAALLIRSLFIFVAHHTSHQQSLEGAAVTIILGAIITGAACIANDNIQDLKVGYLVGATPWKQQLMLILGAIVAAFVTAPVMELLFNVYGIAGVFPHPGMNPAETLAAPPAALMAAVTQGVFHHDLPWHMTYIGAGIIAVFIILQPLFKKLNINLSILSIAIGIYLPLSTTTPLFVGGLLSYLCARRLAQQSKFTTLDGITRQRQRGILLACGLVAGAALMDVVIAIPFAWLHDPNVLRIMPTAWLPLANVLGLLTLIALATWIYTTICRPRQ